jgi:hypothetical protein
MARVCALTVLVGDWFTYGVRGWSWRRQCAERAGQVGEDTWPALDSRAVWRAHAMQHPAYNQKLYRQVNDALAAAVLVAFSALIVLLA